MPQRDDPQEWILATPGRTIATTMKIPRSRITLSHRADRNR